MTMQRQWFTGTALLAGLIFAAGCDKSTGTGGQPPAAKKEKEKEKPAHEHPHEGPHDGALVEWGEEEYHPEFTVDHKTQEATVYILDGNAKKPKAIDAKSITLTLKLKPSVTVELKAQPQDGDPAGMSSRFVGKHEALGKVQEFEGTISGTVGGKPYSGDFKEEPHDHKDDKK